MRIASGSENCWELIDKNRRHVDATARAVKKADALYLSTDPDREGEAISWHLFELLRGHKALNGKAVHRVVFHEITKKAIQEAIAQPRSLSMDLVNAQQARRALDYLVGFNLSRLLWKKIRRGLSAGRVQSPALRLIAEREEEIEAFTAREYWTLEAVSEKAGQAFSAKLTQFEGRKVEQFSFTDADSAHAARTAVEQAAGGRLRVAKVEKKQKRRERILSQIFIKSEKYGTRSSTIVTVDKQNNVRFVEKTYFANSGRFANKDFNFIINNK